MEQIYLGLDENFRREWHSDKIELSDYFESYAKDVREKCVKDKNFNFERVLQTLLPDNVTLDVETLKKMEELTCVQQLKPTVNHKLRPSKKQENKHPKQKGGIVETGEGDIGFSSQDESNVPLESGEMKNELDYLTSSSSIEDDDDPGENDIQYCGKKMPRKYQRRGISASEHVLLKDNKSRKQNLKAGEDFFLSVQVYPPFFRHHEDPMPGHFIQEIRVLSSQTLEVLRDKIICPSDFQDVQGDLSKCPDTPVTFMTRDIYRSAMFYIDNTFYIDKRHKDNVDYSDVICKWALEQGIRVGSTLDMSQGSVGKLTLRFGYPYLFMHQGNCEHLIIFNDARLLNGKDSLFDGDYPLMSSLHRPKAEYCTICLKRSAEWIVADSDRMLHDVTRSCDACFRKFNYIDGKKIGNFKAYRFVDPGTLL